MHERAAEVAREAVAAGADVLADRYGAVDGDLDATFSETDVKAAADVAAEEAILPTLREAFPEHAIYAEESGDHGGTAPYRWTVDPLDGTNDFAAGLPTFATAVALERTDVDGRVTGSTEPGEPLVAAARLPATGEEYVAVRDGGLEYDGEPASADCDRALAEATVATVVGRPVLTDPELADRADALFAPLEDAAKRVLDTWAPVVHWGLLGRGRLEAVVAVHPDREEQVLGELVARESGAATWSAPDDEVFVAAGTEALLADLREALGE